MVANAKMIGVITSGSITIVFIQNLFASDLPPERNARITAKYKDKM